MWTLPTPISPFCAHQTPATFPAAGMRFLRWDYGRARPVLCRGVTPFTKDGASTRREGHPIRKSSWRRRLFTHLLICSADTHLTSQVLAPRASGATETAAAVTQRAVPRCLIPRSLNETPGCRFTRCDAAHPQSHPARFRQQPTPRRNRTPVQVAGVHVLVGHQERSFRYQPGLDVVTLGAAQ
jgi:hypothetical protein